MYVAKDLKTGTTIVGHDLLEVLCDLKNPRHKYNKISCKWVPDKDFKDRGEGNQIFNIPYAIYM